MPNTNRWLCEYALAQVGKRYVYGTYGTLQDGDKVHDCSGLIVGASVCDTVTDGPVRGVMSSVPHYTVSMCGICKTAGTLKPMSQFDYVPGRILFPTNDAPGHVGVYVGDGYTVDAMGAAYGVVQQKLSEHMGRWKYFGQLPYFEVDTTSTDVISIPTTDTNQPTASGVTVVNAQRSVNVVNVGGTVYAQNFTPFIATILPGTTGVNYEVLKNLRVSGVMFNAGYLFDNSNTGHTSRAQYRDSMLKSNVELCTKHDMPYALYAISRAKNRIEADAECKELYYVISQFPPKLGIWLYPDMHNQKSVNEEIIDLYYNYFIKWGLKDRCGIYTDKSRMNQFDWGKYTYKFYLWLEDNLSAGDLDTVDDLLLRPELFEVP